MKLKSNENFNHSSTAAHNVNPPSTTLSKYNNKNERNTPEKMLKRKLKNITNNFEKKNGKKNTPKNKCAADVMSS